MALLITNILCKCKHLGMSKIAYLAEVCINIDINDYNNRKMGEGKE